MIVVGSWHHHPDNVCTPSQHDMWRARLRAQFGWHLELIVTGVEDSWAVLPSVTGWITGRRHNGGWVCEEAQIERPIW
jgi:hypothetical protein